MMAGRALLLVFLLVSLPLVLDGHVEFTVSQGAGYAPLRWPGPTVTYRLNSQISPNLPNMEVGSNPVGAINAAFARLGAASGLSLQNGGTTPTQDAVADGVNLVTFAATPQNLALTAGALAATLIQVDLNNLRITEADIAFNPNAPWSTLGTAGLQDLESVCTHEAGHFVGQEHSPLLDASMFPFIVAGSKTTRSLSADDLAGLRTIYPNSSANTLGSVTGNVQRATGQGVFGAHVILVCAITGRAVNGTLSLPGGAFTVSSVPPGLYRVAVEPLDGPFPSAALSLGLWGSAPADTNFRTTWLGGAASPTPVAVRAGLASPVGSLIVASSPTINVTGAGISQTTGFSMVGSFPTPVTPPFNGFLAVTGPLMNTYPDAAFSTEGPFVTLTGGSVGSGILGNGEGWKAFPFSVQGAAPPGGYVIRLRVGGQESLLAGAIDVQPLPTPAAYSVSYGSACLGSNGPLNLTAPFAPTVGQALFSLFLQGSVAGETAYFLMALSPDWVTPFPGCTLGLNLTNLLVPFPGYAVPITGTLTQLATPIPSQPALSGLDVYVQAVSTDATSLGGFALSNALQVHIE